MTVKAEFHFDFGSPNAYLARALLPDIERRTGVAFEHVPILLGGVFKLTNNKSPVLAFGGIKNKMEYVRLEMARFIRRHGLTAFKFNPFFPLNTLQLMRGAVATQLDGVFQPYAQAMFKGIWEDAQKMDDPAVWLAAMQAAGLDAQHILQRSQEEDVKAKLIAATEASVARGTFGAPTFFVDNEIYFGKDSLADVEAQIQHGK